MIVSKFSKKPNTYAQRGKLSVSVTGLVNDGYKKEHAKAMVGDLNGVGSLGEGGKVIGENDKRKQEKEVDKRYAPNYLSVNPNTAAGKQLASLNEAAAHAFRRANTFIDPVNKEIKNFGAFQDSYLADRINFDKTFNANSFLVNKYGTPEAYYEAVKQNTDERIRRISNSTINELPSRFNQDFINKYTLVSPENLGVSYNKFVNRDNRMYLKENKSNPVFNVDSKKVTDIQNLGITQNDIDLLNRF